jgi:TatD DNase family protein
MTKDSTRPRSLTAVARPEPGLDSSAASQQGPPAGSVPKSPGAALTRVAPLIDIGINLAHDSYDPDRDAVLARAEAAGVVQMVITGSSGPSSRQAMELAQAHRGRLFATAGVHPHHASDLTQELLAELEELGHRPEIVAVGECGLDYFRNFSPQAAQRSAFHRQLELAARVGKPVFLHERDAHEDFVAILREHRAELAGGVAHCFTGTQPQLMRYLELDLAIGITGWICDERRGAHLLPLMKEIPAKRLLLETDGPYLLPRNLEPKPAGRRNEPAYLPHVALAVAAARAEPVQNLADSSTAAARELFRISY